MAKDKPAEKAEATPVLEKPEPKFKLEKLREHYHALFGVSESTFIGATAGLPEDKEYSVNEIKKTIERWNAKEAK